MGKETNWSVSIYGIVSWILFNSPRWVGVAGQYWFLFALLYTYITYAVVTRLELTKQAYWIAGAMFIVYILLAQVAHLCGIWIPNMIYRNWLVEGFAYFMLGHWIHQNQDKLRLGNKYLLAIFFVSTLLCWVERYLMGRDFGVNIMTIPQVTSLFLYAVNNPTKHKGAIQVIGKRYSMYVYILHPAIWHTLEFVYDKNGLSDNLVALYIMPILVIGLSLFFSHIVYLLNQLIKKNDRVNNPIQ